MKTGIAREGEAIERIEFADAHDTHGIGATALLNRRAAFEKLKQRTYIYICVCVCVCVFMCINKHTEQRHLRNIIKPLYKQRSASTHILHIATDGHTLGHGFVDEGLVKVPKIHGV